MGDTKGSPFQGLDKALLRSTRPQEQTAADQQTGLPASPQASIPAAPPTSKPANQLVKATFYLTPENIMQLEHLRIERLQKGEKVDKSALVREAIEKFTSKPA